MKDVCGRELKEGDKVVSNLGGGYTYALAVCTVVGFTPKKIRLKLLNKCSEEDSFLREPSQVAVVN